MIRFHISTSQNFTIPCMEMHWLLAVPRLSFHCPVRKDIIAVPTRPVILIHFSVHFVNGVPFTSTACIVQDLSISIVGLRSASMNILDSSGSSCVNARADHFLVPGDSIKRCCFNQDTGSGIESACRIVRFPSSDQALSIWR